jgi:hypothetical protein
MNRLIALAAAFVAPACFAQSTEAVDLPTRGAVPELRAVTAARTQVARQRQDRHGVSTGDPCEPFSCHGYNGIEAKTVADIAAFINEHPAKGP